MSHREKILYIDCFAGIAGDMMLAALLDLGSEPADAIHAALDQGLPELGFRLEVEEVERSGIGALLAKVVLRPEKHEHGRTFADIRRLLEKSALGDGVRRRALEMFQALAEAEGSVHRRHADEVHFHEVGAVDSIVDIVAVAAGLDALGAELCCSTVPVGRGFVECRHGTLPVPAPATLALLKGIPVEGTQIADELVTPTGATILRTQVRSFGLMPAMRPTAIGWGAGTRDHPGRPGLLRLVLGEGASAHDSAPCVVIEANIDDMTAELAAHVIERSLAAGALDAWVAPVTMKKGRPAMQLGLLTRLVDRDRLATLLLAETTSIGLRFHEVGRMELQRRVVEVETPFGTIPVKISGDRAEGPHNVAPEFDACRAAALSHDVPLKHVLAAATAVALTKK